MSAPGNFRSDPPKVAIVDDAELAPTERLAEALDRVGFWDIVARSATDRAPRIVIKPELAGFAGESPSITDPALVEALVDLLHDRDFGDVAIVATADSSSLWAANRDVYALSDLLGYRFATPKGRSYDIIDLSDSPDRTPFPEGGLLNCGGLAREWLDADIRIVFTKNRTDEEAGYALCLDTLIGVLPLIDKNLHYRQRRHPGDVVAALLTAAPVHCCLIDAITSAHGAAARRSPEPITTGTIIAASDPVLADYVGAMKMGLDPVVSPIFERVIRTHPLPRRYAVSGLLAPYASWKNVPLLLLQTTQMRRSAELLDRMIEPWLQRVDPELFPLKHPLDARINAVLAAPLAESELLAVLINAAVALVGHAVASYRTMFDKDALFRQSVPLGLDVTAFPEQAFDDIVEELLGLEPIAETAPAVSDELRWRYADNAVVFQYSRCLPMRYDLFVRKVDIARAIQLMNDYLGGVLVPLAFDDMKRPIRQAERNIYLPQPNYLVLCQGKPIDVSKLEVVKYGADRHRLYWKTITSENRSAIHDDGIASFDRSENGTRITIVGRQQFILPLFWQVFDLNLMPDLKATLVTHAYQTFFDRTVANFEACVEGRDIRIGRPTDEPAPPTIERLMPSLARLGEILSPVLRQSMPGPVSHPAGDRRWVDADGFTHITPALPPEPVRNPAPPELDCWIAAANRLVDGLRQAVRRDLAQAVATQ